MGLIMTVKKLREIIKEIEHLRKCIEASHPEDKILISHTDTVLEDLDNEFDSKKYTQKA